jgi:uncharacterized protein YqjF (DUF2071 family)
MYQLRKKQKTKAKQLGVQVFPSENIKYKVDIYDHNGCYILSCGAKNYNDFFSFKEKYGLPYAKERRHLYYQRHHKDIHKEGGRGYYAWTILWDGEIP